jgi:hypothetical protein
MWVAMIKGWENFPNIKLDDVNLPGTTVGVLGLTAENSEVLLQKTLKSYCRKLWSQ